MQVLLLLVSWVVVVVVGGEEGAVEVVLEGGGVVRGVERTSKGGKGYFAFSAIPYAEPPVDRQRFMPPVPLPPLEGVLDATRDGPPCAQAALGIVAGVEDCLNLYVYTPEVPRGGENVSLPVVVWLHGGSFVVGGAAPLDEYLVMDRQIVLVVPQYRLGLLGFFHTPTGTSTGNMGMLDQVLALRWVQDNIRAFGGDPAQVTLAGDCAGGAAALYHMLSPLSSGLFHRVLSLSGSPLSPWALYAKNHRFMLILANYVKCPAHDQRLTVKCFQETDLWELLDPVQMLCESRDLLVGNHRLAPTVQEVGEDSHPSTLFLHTHPLRLLHDAPPNPVPVLLGVTKNVGTYLVDMLLYDFILYKLEEEPDFLQMLLPMLLRESRISDAASHEQEFLDFYFPNEDFTNLTAILPGLAKMLGDIHYQAGVLSAATHLSKHVSTWVMRYEFEGGPSLFTQRYPDPSVAPQLPPQAGHGDEMALILPEERRQLTPGQEEVSAHLLDVLERFAYGRPPREDWPPFNEVSHSTLVFTENGDIDKQSFSAPDRTNMLLNIHSYLHKKVLEEMRKEEEEEEEEDAGRSGGGGGRDEL